MKKEHKECLYSIEQLREVGRYSYVQGQILANISGVFDLNKYITTIVPTLTAEKSYGAIDEEIEVIANKEVDKIGCLEFDDNKQIGWFRQGVKNGYKQALKDLRLWTT